MKIRKPEIFKITYNQIQQNTDDLEDYHCKVATVVAEDIRFFYLTLP